MTKNITLAVPDEILERYRAEAVRLKSSVNAMIRKHMAETVGARTEEQSAAIARMRARSENGPRATYAPPFDRAALWDRGSQD
jgi:ABC-type xylose transport system substrate-binding protein